MSTITALLSSPESVGVWTLVPERSTIAFRGVSMYGLLPVKGRFKQFSGGGQIAEGGAVSGRLDIKAASLDTKLRKRDDDLRKPEFFDVERHPDITVVVGNGQPVDGDTLDLRADLTVKGTTKPMALRAKVEVLDDGAVRLISAITVDRHDFGVSGNMVGMIRDKATVSADLVFRRAAG